MNYNYLITFIFQHIGGKVFGGKENIRNVINKDRKSKNEDKWLNYL